MELIDDNKLKKPIKQWNKTIIIDQIILLYIYLSNPFKEKKKRFTP